MKKLQILLIIVLAVGAIATQVVSVYMSNTNALDSVSATKLKAQIETVTEENVQLSAKVLALSSYNNIASRAAEMGFEDNRDIISVYDPVSVAIRQ